MASSVRYQASWVCVGRAKFLWQKFAMEEQRSLDFSPKAVHRCLQFIAFWPDGPAAP